MRLLSGNVLSGGGNWMRTGRAFTLRSTEYTEYSLGIKEGLFIISIAFYFIYFIYIFFSMGFEWARRAGSGKPQVPDTDLLLHCGLKWSERGVHWVDG